MKQLILILIFTVVSCKTTSKTVVTPTDTNATTFYFIRHAEKESDGTKNPDLNTSGMQRANNYVSYFEEIKLDAIYSTNFKRTLNTVKPLTIAKNLTSIIYNSYKINYQDFKNKHKNQTVLIVGHSNTTPEFANKIIGKMVYSQITEDNFSNIYKVTIIDDNVTYELLTME
jgi:broad specificity phosphatase PhoE